MFEEIPFTSCSSGHTVRHAILQISDLWEHLDLDYSTKSKICRIAVTDYKSAPARYDIFPKHVIAKKGTKPTKKM